LALKKQNFAEGKIAIFDETCIYKRIEYWQFCLWLPKENKYARKSLRTLTKSTALERGKAAYLEIYGKNHEFALIGKAFSRKNSSCSRVLSLPG
jgi:hypothetical protein